MDILQKSKTNQRRIGLTGGIASGKTTITNYISKHKNIPILDADKLSRELIKPNTYGYKKIIDYFGSQIIDHKNNSEKAINRKLLRKIIFKNSESKEWMEKLLRDHPQPLSEPRPSMALVFDNPKDLEEAQTPQQCKVYYQLAAVDAEQHPYLSHEIQQWMETHTTTPNNVGAKASNDESYAAVHIPVDIPVARKIKKAKAAIEKEW